MAMYDINGKIIESGGSSENFNEKTVNLLNPNNISYGNQWANNSWWNPNEAYFSVDIPVEYGKIYYCNLTRYSCATDVSEKLDIGGVNFDGLDSSGKFVASGITSTQPIDHYDGSIPVYHNYVIITINDELVKTVRIYGKIVASLTTHGEYNGMFSEEYSSPNFNELGIEYLKYAYGDNLYELNETTYKGLMEQMMDDSGGKSDEMLEFKGIKPNPIYGKHVWLVGDSNTAYNADDIRSVFEDVYGCTFTTYAAAGYAWGTADTENGFNTTDSSGIGQLNRICSQAEYLESEYFEEDKHIFLFMLGTNASSGGNGDANTNDASTAYSAMNYCFEKISRYARVGNAIGVILPVCINSTDKENQIALCKKYAIPYIDLVTEARIYDDGGNNYLMDGGNHIARNGIKHLKRMIGKWVAYQI